MNSLEPGLRGPGEAQQTLDNRIDPIRLPQQFIHQLCIFVLPLVGPTEILDRAADGGQGITNLVRRSGRQLARHRQPLRPHHPPQAQSSLLIQHRVVERQASLKGKGCQQFQIVL